MMSSEALVRIDLKWAEQRLVDAEKRLASLRGKIFTPHELVVKYMAQRGYGATDIERLTGIPRPKVFVYAKKLGLSLATRHQGYSYCRSCDKAFVASYRFCPHCGKPVPLSRTRQKFSAKGEPL